MKARSKPVKRDVLDHPKLRFLRDNIIGRKSHIKTPFGRKRRRYFDYVASEAAKGVARVQLDSGVPVIFGVLTTENIEQAVERAGTKSGNKGWDGALSALEMADLVRRLDEATE